MNSNNEAKFYSDKNLDKLEPKKKTIDLIKKYLSSQPKKIKTLQNISKVYYKVINEFIDITQNYSSEIESLALRITPDYSIEGQISQALQGILLFQSEGLNNLVKKLKNENINEKQKEIDNIITKFNEYKQLYFEKIKESISLSENFKKELERYEEFLIYQIFKEQDKKRNKHNEDEIINENKNKGNKITQDNNEQKEKLNFFDDAIILNDDNSFEIYEENYGLNDINNEEEVIKKQKLISSSVNESNDILNNIKDYLSKELTKAWKNLFNICDCLIEELLKFINFQQKNFDIQKSVINNLSKNIKFEEPDKNILKQTKIKLKYLEIYQNIRQKNNKLIIKDKTPDLEKTYSDKELINIKKYVSNSQIKNYNLDGQKKNLLPMTRTTVNFTIDINQEKEQKMEKFKYMIKKLRRIDIIKIFEKIKSLNINIAESDIKIIEQEINFNIIHDILISIFFNTEKYTEKEKNILLNLFENKRIYILYFIGVLNDHRGKGNFDVSIKTINYLGELFKYINNLILNKNDIELFKYIFILSMTYYHFFEEQNQKIYLFSYIKDHPYYQNVKFWEDYLKDLVEHEFKRHSIDVNIDLENKEIKKLKNMEKEKINNIYFSNFLTVAKSMADFQINKKMIINFIDKYKEKYNLSQEQIENICIIYDVSFKDNQNNYKGDNLLKENNIKSDNEIINEIPKKEEKDLIKEDNINRDKEDMIKLENRK